MQTQFVSPFLFLGFWFFFPQANEILNSETEDAVWRLELTGSDIFYYIQRQSWNKDAQDVHISEYESWGVEKGESRGREEQM